MFSRCVRYCGLLVVLVLLAAPSAWAQVAGKLQGRVTSAQTGEPIPGASVRVIGTTRGAVTSADGFYFINKIPAGLHTVLAEFIGFRGYQIENERILAGQTTTLDFELEITAIEIEALVVQGERNPLVPRDQVSSKAIVTGELIDVLPIDNAQSIVLLMPGVINTNAGRTIRGSRPNEEAVYIDGVRTRRYSSAEAEPIELPTNSLAQVDVTTGGIGAQFGDAQSGVVNYVTRTGGTNFSGSFSLFTDTYAPKDWRTGFNRAEATFGGPISRAANLSFFLAGVAQGQKYTPLNEGFTDVPILLPSGIATMDDGSEAVFNLPRESGSPSGVDSLSLAFPSYVEWDNGRTFPFTPSDEYTLVSKVSWGIPGGSSLDLSYKREREQDINLSLGARGGQNELYNPDGFDGVFSTANVWTLGGYFILTQSATSALALDLKASYQTYSDQFGDLDPQWLLDHREPSLGFNFGNMQFLGDPDDFPVTEALINGVKSGVIPREELQLFPGRTDLAAKQGLRGVAGNLRMNPYGLRRFFPISGFGRPGAFAGSLGHEYRREKDWVFNGTVDWQLGRYNRIQAGGELVLIDAVRQRIPLFDGTGIPAMNEPTRAGLFITNRIDLGDVVVDVGLRWDYFDSDGEYPRVPGFVFNVPDSLKADFFRVEPGEGPTVDRLFPLEDCGGAATEADRINPETGLPVCKPNFIRASTKSELSPRLGIAFPVTVKSTFRLSYSHNVQTPALHGQGFGALGTASGQTALFNDVFSDLQGGVANTNTLYGRDIDLPRTVLFEAGYRQLIGEDLVVDVAAYSKTVRNALTYRKLQVEDPNTGAPLFINQLTNADYTQIRGIDLRVDKRVGEVSNLTANYSFVDARGTGSDPFTYEGLLLRRNTNLSIITGEPVVPPDVILPLETSRTHNISGTFSLLFPTDFQQGSFLNTLFSDFGAFATFGLASGLPFTRLNNAGAGQVGPPTDAGLGGTPAEELNSSHLSWEKRLDLRVTKGLRFGNQRARLFADFRNLLNFANTNLIYLETGNEVNEAFREKLLNQELTDPLLDGDADIDDFNIALESPENEFNKFSLIQAEKRFGNGDGIFTVEEQTAAFGAWYDLTSGAQLYRESNQSLRLGFEFLF